MHQANVGRTRGRISIQTFILFYFLFVCGAEESLREMACLIGGGLRELPTNYMERQHAIRATIQMMNYMCKGTNGNTQLERERDTHTSETLFHHHG
jgi:hypothetical protein